MRFPDRRESGEARSDGGQPGSRPRGWRQSAARPRRRPSEGEGTRAARVAAHRGGSRVDRPRNEDRSERGVCGGGPRVRGKTREAGAHRDSAGEGLVEPQRRHPDRCRAGNGSEGLRANLLDRRYLRGPPGLHGKARAEIQGRVNSQYAQLRIIWSHFAMTFFLASASICRDVYPRDRRIVSVSWPFVGTRAGFRVSVIVCFAGWEMTWSFPTPGTSTVGSRPRAFTCGSLTTSGTRFTPAIGNRSAKNSGSHSASVRSRNRAASIATAPWTPPARSATGTPGIAGRRASRLRVTDKRPASASKLMSCPGRSLYGPFWPYPEKEQ